MNALSCSSRLLRASSSGLALSLVLAASAAIGTALAGETCRSPCMARITGEEEFIYVWTLGVGGLRLVTGPLPQCSTNFR